MFRFIEIRSNMLRHQLGQDLVFGLNLLFQVGDPLLLA